MELCRALHAENGMFTMSEDKVRRMLHRAFDKQGAIVGALGPSGHIEGAIYLLISDYWYSDDWHLSELFSFVLPQYRKSNNAKELITFAKRCSDEIGIPLIIGVISNERTESKVRLYQKELAKPAGAFFVYDQHMPSAFPPRKIYEAEVRHMLEEKCKEVEHCFRQVALFLIVQNIFGTISFAKFLCSRLAEDRR